MQLRKCVKHCGEFVDHDDESRECGGQPGLTNVASPRIAKGAFAVMQLGGQARKRTRSFPLIEVCDQANAVWQGTKRTERGAALEIDQ